MDVLCIFVTVLLGVVSCRQDQINTSVLEVTAGDNVTLYCDCKKSAGVDIVWYRNCSHENQPPLLLTKQKHQSPEKFPHYEFLRNKSSNSFDLLITDITESEEGLYYCGTEQSQVEHKDGCIISTVIYSHSNVTTRIILNSNLPNDSISCSTTRVCIVPWIMEVFTPALTILSSLFSFILFYHFSQKTDNEPQVHQRSSVTRRQTRYNQGEEMYLTRVLFCATDEQTAVDTGNSTSIFSEFTLKEYRVK